jgi:hypothetical protein
MKVLPTRQPGRPRIPLAIGAHRTKLTTQGLLKILQRTNSAIRDDGRWYADPAVVDEIASARRVLGLDRHKSIDSEGAS